MSLPKHTSPSPLSSSPSRQSVRRTSGSRPQSIIDRPGTAQQVTDILEEHNTHEAAPAPTSAPASTPTPQVRPPTEHERPHETTPTFQPFFTLIEDANSSEYHHPTVHYIFSDDDTDIVTEAALRALESEADPFLTNGKRKSKPTQDPSHHPHEADGTQGTYPEDEEYAHQRKESLLPDPIPGVRDNYVILDIDYASPDGAQTETAGPNPDGAASAHEAQGTGPSLPQQQQQGQNQSSAQKYTVTSAHSLSPAWQVLNTQLVPAPTFENNNSTGGQPPNGSLMLKIKGTAGLPMNMPGKDKDRERSSQRLEDMMDQFAKRLTELRQVIGAEEQAEDAEQEVEGDVTLPEEGDPESAPAVDTEEPIGEQTHVEGGGDDEGQSAES
ncbi:ubiquitin-protein ligase Anaphase Promoting Complex [Aspergillus brasiliensis]|uniref:Ubiquitin-protein ligase Anaphase Promoting Complex n=1 Tax=Aspergillus brasiliensis TaxID=319629 RepID=A0A9W5Z297_9EURO|nr:ubiquitin-protein ligase Anaphase Promoting Complex [Aspergillus brasiliensis]GKZ51208.1 ubiquitin-protein ligase Anaphase Promoting Complex [Aspergillus brasiliensis]